MVASSAIEVCDVSKSYESTGFRKIKTAVLKGINLSVPEGIIYGLLGPSGCGKTTLLRCLVGRIRPDKGNILVFGERPGSPNSKIPGLGVGYMPQDLALYNELNILESLTYHGQVYHLNKRKVKLRIAFLLNFLHLPNKRKLIQDLSGGQQRRVSFALALLHEPPLLILDEPTVGVDPILRESIWTHLVELCASGQVTVLITTHYIEEARQANKVGLMRNGKMLTEDAPDVLLNHHSLPTLEDVYLKLCRQEDLETNETQNEESLIRVKLDSSFYRKLSAANFRKQKEKYSDFFQPSFPSIKTILAIVYKNVTRLRRYLLAQVFTSLLPAIIMYFFCSAVGGNLQKLPVAVMNEDYDYGVKYLEKIDSFDMRQIPVSSLDEGFSLVAKGDADLMIEITPNFTYALNERFKNLGRNMSKNIIGNGSIHLWFDATIAHNYYTLQRVLYDAVRKFAFEDLHLENRGLMQIDDPIYGTLEPYFTEFMAPGILIVAIFLIAAALVAIFIVRDRNTGNIDRTYVLGITPFEIMAGYIITAMITVVIQTFTSILVVFVGFNVRCNGSVVLVSLLTLLQGLCGVSYGLLISVTADSEAAALLLTLGSLFPFVLLNGTLWPLVAAHQFIQTLALVIPQTYAIEALRWIMLRGRGLSWAPVWIGFLSTIIWISVILIASAIVMRIKR